MVFIVVFVMGSVAFVVALVWSICDDCICQPMRRAREAEGRKEEAAYYPHHNPSDEGLRSSPCSALRQFCCVAKL